MSRRLVFYAGLLHSEVQPGEILSPRDLPDGAYVYAPRGDQTYWYLVRFCNAEPINLCDVPKELRTYVLLIT